MAIVPGTPARRESGNATSLDPNGPSDNARLHFPNLHRLDQDRDALLILFQLCACECLPAIPSDIPNGHFRSRFVLCPLAGIVRRPLAIGLRPAQDRWRARQNIDYSWFATLFWVL